MKQCKPLFLCCLFLFVPAQALPPVETDDDSLQSAPAAPTPINDVDKCRPQTIEQKNVSITNVPALGVAIELLSCVFSNVGLVTEKRALLKEEKLLGNAADVRSYKLPMWWLGFVCFASGQVLSGIALSLMSVVVVTPLGSFTVIVNLFTSYFLIGEKSGFLQVLCSLLIVAGCVMTTVFAPWSKASSSLDCFHVYVGNANFHLVAAIFVACFLPVFAVSRILVLPAQKMTSNQAEWPVRARMGRWLYPVAAGLISVWTINIGSALMRLLSQAFTGHASEIMTSYELYVVLIVYLFAIGIWQHLMNACMLVLDAAFVIPIHFALFTMLTLPLSGSLHGTLKDWHPDVLSLGAYLAGSALNVLGMFGLLLIGSKSSTGSFEEIEHLRESEYDKSALLDKETNKSLSMQ